MAIEDGAVARLLPADCLSIQEVGATGEIPQALSLSGVRGGSASGMRGVEHNGGRPALNQGRSGQSYGIR